MKIYLYSKKDAETPEREKIQERLMDYFHNNGVMVISNLSGRTYEDSQLSFANMDGLVIEGGDVAAEVGYLIALALAQRKPILYLLNKGKAIPDQIRSLKDDKNLKKLFIIKFYSERSLDNDLLDFIDIIETGELRREVPTIKFTLRFTPRVERYLRWKSMKTKISKANILRELVDGAIKGDETYQSHLRRQRKDEQVDQDDESQGDAHLDKSKEIS